LDPQTAFAPHLTQLVRDRDPLATAGHFFCPTIYSPTVGTVMGTGETDMNSVQANPSEFNLNLPALDVRESSPNLIGAHYNRCTWNTGRITNAGVAALLGYSRTIKHPSSIGFCL